MKMIRCLLGGFLLLVAMAAEAQYSLHLDPASFATVNQHSFEFNNSSAINTPVLSVNITNQTGTPFSDSIYLGYTVTTGGVTRFRTSDTSQGTGIGFVPDLITIAPQGTAQLNNVIFSFSSPVFVVGSSIVVIWPIVKAHPEAQVDSVTISVEVVDHSTGIAEAPDSKQNIFLSGSELVVRNGDNEIGSIRIYDLSGRLLVAKDISGDMRLPMQSYTDGIYTVEAIATDGSRHTYKVLKQSGR